MKNQFYPIIQELQNTITTAFESLDTKVRFEEDVWKRPEGGGGHTRVIEQGDVIEKGGINISAVHGTLPESMQVQFNVTNADFYACGLSLVIHPKNPMAPTVHANWRFFELYTPKGEVVDQWFGGGLDLTPYYIFEEDIRHFHQVCKKVCDDHHPEYYARFKKQCDTYFYNSHRKEARGVGGLFFDYLRENKEFTLQSRYDFVTHVANSFLTAYLPILLRTKDLPFTSKQREWQEIRRGRYVEFNLVHDKGTLFGLKTNGRIESILMSLPPKVQWRYNHQPIEKSEEARLLTVLKNPKDWIH